jgi:PKD repeat protein
MATPMKRYSLFIFFLFSRVCDAQNLVPNGDFESYSKLPTGNMQYDLCTGWNNCGGFGSPDYFHLKGTGPAQLPHPYPATVYPHGDSAIMGLILYDISYRNFREYVSHPLLNALTIGQLYQLTFYVTNGTPPIYNGGSGCDHFSVAFSTIPLSQTTPLIINFTPQYIYNGFLYNNNWQQVTFNFIADSAYQYITFGSFVNDNIQQLEPYDSAQSYSEAYYFIDDVSLTAQPSVPLINLSCTDTTFCDKHCIDFFDLSTNNPTSWQWVFPGADSATSELQNPTNICYSTYGSFDVTLIACNAAGCDTLVLPDFINEYPLPIPIVSIAASSNAICVGNAVTFTAAASNAGQNPSYEWKVNGVSEEAGTNFFTTNSINNGDTINCTIKAASNYACGVPSIAISNNIIMKVNAGIDPTINISASANNVCYGTPITINATIDAADSLPQFQWKLNNNSTGSNTSLYNSNNFKNGDSVQCILTLGAGAGDCSVSLVS